MLELKSIDAKRPNTEFDIHPDILKRFSARSFQNKLISKDILNTLFEAASWAPSSMNEQPWHYKFAHQGTDSFHKIWECLMPGNQPWANDASVLIISLAKKNFHIDNKPNRHYLYDTGAANMLLLLQAASMDIYGHEMGGFDLLKVKEVFSIGEEDDVACIIALGYLDSHEKLVEPFKTREIAPRSRKPVSEFTRELSTEGVEKD